MITKRIIPCLDVRSGRVVKGTNFEGIRDVADPVEMARMYNAAGADELVFYDITASFEGRALFTDILTRVASEVFIPLTVGGGINTLEDFDRVLKCGADKVSVNSGALRDPDLIPAAARRYGNQCVVLSADVKRVNGQFRVFAKGGREDTGRDALDWIRWCVDHGAGEICLNSIDTDGVRNGFDLEMLDAVAARVDVPIIASGGAGKKEDFLELFHHKGIDAGLAAFDQLIQALPAELFQLRGDVYFVEETALGPGVAGRAGLDHFHHQCVLVAVGSDGHHPLHVAAGLALAPDLLTAAAPEHGATFGNGEGQRLSVHVREGKHLFGVVILHDGRDQALFVKFQFHGRFSLPGWG